MNTKDLVVNLAINMVAGIILYFVLPGGPEDFDWLLLGHIFAFGFILLSVFLMTYRTVMIRRIGITGVYRSMTGGKGSTAKIIKQVNSSFSFMGIAASKWIDELEALTKMIKSVGKKRAPVRFLLLDPESEHAKEFSRIMYGGDGSKIPNIIRQSETQIKKLQDEGLNIDLRYYNFEPVFRIALVNNNKEYVGFYRTDTKGESSPQIIIDENITKFHSFKHYFENTWDSVTNTEILNE